MTVCEDLLMECLFQFGIHPNNNKKIPLRIFPKLSVVKKQYVSLYKSIPHSIIFICVEFSMASNLNQVYN